MKNRIVSIVVGVITGVLFVYVGEAISHQFYPPPENLDFSDREAVKAFMETLPSKAFLGLMLIWACSSFIGGLVSARLSKSNWKRSSLITGGILLLGSLINMILIPHPAWVMIITMLVYIPAAYAGGLVGHKK